MESNSNLIKLTDCISVLPAVEKPLSCDVVFVKTDKATWIFDTGVTSQSADLINSVEGTRNIVISHFHPDHTFNLSRVKYDNLYVSAHTKKYVFGKGTVVDHDTKFEGSPEVDLVAVPSCHAKGCIALVCGDYAFMGDSTYCTMKMFHHVYNTNLLGDMIKVMEALPVKYLCLSHDKNFVQNKDDVVNLYKGIYSRKTSDSAYINVDDFFNPDGSVKQN